MHRTLVGDFEQLLALIRVKIALHRNRPLDTADHALLRLAGFAVLGVDPMMFQRNCGALKRN